MRRSNIKILYIQAFNLIKVIITIIKVATMLVTVTPEQNSYQTRELQSIIKEMSYHLQSRTVVCTNEMYFNAFW